MTVRPHPLMNFVRETPLEQCPNPVCRRSGLCHAQNPEYQCRKYCREINEWRLYLADKITHMMAEWDRANPEEAARRPPPEPFSAERWGQVELPAIRRAIEEVKAQRAREAGRQALARRHPPKAAIAAETETQIRRRKRKERQRHIDSGVKADTTPHRSTSRSDP